MRKKKEKMSVINATVPLYLKEYLECACEKKNYSSISDYLRELIRKDMNLNESDGFNEMAEAVIRYLNNLDSKEDSSEIRAHELLIKLNTIMELVKMGHGIKEMKIKNKSPKISKQNLQKELLRKMEEDFYTEEVPGFIEVSEKRKRKLLNG